MVLTAVRGALGFLTRLPVGHSETAWDAFRQTPVAFPLAAYPIGALIALPVGLPVPDPVVAFFLLVDVIVLTGVNHADGLADLGDAAVVHGDSEQRRAVMKDTTVGVGAVLALGSVLVGVALAGWALAALPSLIAIGIVVASEVGAKLGMAAVACLGTATHEGLGSAFTGHGPRQLIAPTVAVLPAFVLTGRSLAGCIAVLVGGTTGCLMVLLARRALGGVSGDVFGATNEIGRVLALHAGVIAWTLS